MSATVKDYFQLHFLIFLWGFTAVAGVIITIPAVEMVLYRTAIALITLYLVLLARGNSVKVDSKRMKQFVFTGMIVGVHWITFFLSAKISTASVCLAGFATSTFWTSLLEPIINKRAISFVEIILGICVLLGIVVIFSFEVDHALGLTIGIVSALAQATFSIFNGNFTKSTAPLVITFYEMVGALLCTLVFLPLYYFFFFERQISLIPTFQDILLISLMAIVCTVYAYTKAIELMKRISAFVLNLSLNLEPVYGIVLAYFVLGDKEKMTSGFYLGALIIIICVLSYPVLRFLNLKYQKLNS
jgi:drug/metabolite transporter (DMT)-like permease